ASASSSGSSDEEPLAQMQRQSEGKSSRSPSAEDHPAVQRLKRYLLACGVHCRYAKLLSDCHSRSARVSRLQEELQQAGMKGRPKRTNVWSLYNAPTTSATTATSTQQQRQQHEDEDVHGHLEQSPAKLRALPSDEDSAAATDEDEAAAGGGRPRRGLSAWAGLRGIVSDDGDSGGDDEVALCGNFMSHRVGWFLERYF
ncbi:unnamed protein product, partial [Lampetra fluviatilis]